MSLFNVSAFTFLSFIVIGSLFWPCRFEVAPPRRQEWFDVYGLESEVTAFRWSHARPTGRARSRVLAGVTRTVPGPCGHITPNFASTFGWYSRKVALP